MFKKTERTKCENCVYAESHTKQYRKCQRRSPVVDHEGDTVFPIVYKNWHCGEFQDVEEQDDQQ